MTLEINAVELTRHGDRTRLEAEIGGHPLWYEVPTSHLNESAVGDALLQSALLVAMLRNEPLIVPDSAPVTSLLLANTEQIQRTFHMWNPRFAIVPVQAATREPEAGTGDALFFAGGVDSSYELLHRRDRLDHLVCMHGFDFTLTDDAARESADRLAIVATHYDTELVIVTSNHSRFLAHHGVSRLIGHGLTLGATGCLLGFRTCLIASSSTLYEIPAWGSHPLLDRYFSNGSTQFEHSDNATSRLEKTTLIGKDPFMLDNLRVCWEYHDKNCGRCLKCLRTMAALEVLGVQGPFPQVADVKAYRRLAAEDDPCWTTELYVAARDGGQERMARMLRQGLRLHDLRVAIRHLSQAVLGAPPRAAGAAGSTGSLAKWDLRPDLR